jgi:hypothetical protein
MLAERLARSATRVEVVNRSAEAVVTRLKLLGIREDSITSIDGNDAVHRFVDKIEVEASRSVVPALMEIEGNPLLLVSTDDLRMSAVVGIESSDNVVRLITEAPSDQSHATRPEHDRESPPLSLDNLRAATHEDPSKTLVAALDDGIECLIVDLQRLVRHVGAGHGGWLVLMPAAAPVGSAWGWRP